MFKRVFVGLLIGCGGCIMPVTTPAPPASPHLTTETPEAKIENIVPAGVIGPDVFPADVNPLTGLEVDDPSALDRRPMVVKISNAPPLVRPQAGIGAADLVFEHYAEGGLTRFSAVFYGQSPDRVGSIRSARLIDYELVPMYGAILAFSGASAGVDERLNDSEFADRLFRGVAYGLPYYWRDEEIEVPHNLFANPNALWALATRREVNQKPELRGLAFSPAPPDGGRPASRIDLRYRATRILWTYDAKNGLYKRFADGQGHFDANTLKQVTAANVVIIYADHQFTDIVESRFQDSVSYSIEIKLWFEGDAVLFRDGRRYEGRWVRPTRESMIGLRTDDGDLLYLKPGQTWFQVVRLPEQQEPLEEWLRVE
ncbi:MAG: DUF3048 domain-containing protein [Chloroflexi bacterium]|nr:DUF3048 domain-containing protein [Chloroflexota bacterium]MDL1885437.1 DUF3048 domain-containing protein [Anaerolineae bacterium CFX8]